MLTSSEVSRRQILGIGAAAGLTAVLPRRSAVAQDSRPTPRSSGGTPRNVIFMIADGMSLGGPSVAEPFSQFARGKGTMLHRLLSGREAVCGFFETHALNSLVTDSAAASTALASGSRVHNGSLNVLPDGTHLTPIGWLARDAGRRIGLVTTTTITHATPAGFASVQASRGEEPLIAPQYLGKVDVLLGGGLAYFDGAKRADKHDLLGEFRNEGYEIWRKRADLKGGVPPKLLGLFADGHLPYTLDQQNLAEIGESVPTLAEMTRAALQILGAPSQGFLLQVEGGRVDHAAHNNDAAAMLWDLLAFDDAIAVALEFSARRDDTLVVITSDHGTGNPGLNGMGGEYRDSAKGLQRLTHATMSYDRFCGAFGGEKKREPAELLAGVKAAFGVELNEERTAVLAEALRGHIPPELNAQHANVPGVLGQTLGNQTGIGWTGTSHTADYVLTTAIGPGAERFAGLLKNTDAYEHMAAAFGVRHKNPSAPAESATARGPVVSVGPA